MSTYADYQLVRLAQANPMPARTGRKDYHKPRKTKGGKSLTKWQRKLVVAWDGEGRTIEDGSHIYNMLTNSEGATLLREEGISTVEALEFFLAHNNRRAIHVIFGGSYDINMILGDLDRGSVERLWSEGKVRWQEYQIGWANRKRFSVRKKQMTRGGIKYSEAFVLWDVLGYFQTNFVHACRKWLGELPILDHIEDMKMRRSTFAQEDLQQILEYNNMENKLLVLLVENLFKALDTCGIELTRYDGAGSIAGALLRQAHIPAHKGEWDASITFRSQEAYGGGRIEAPKVGNDEVGPIFRYDVNSAYPSVAVDLPSLMDGHYVRSERWSGSVNALVVVQWSYAQEAPFYPLWFREHEGSIYYPRKGQGCYWGVEVANLFKYYEEGRDFRIVQSYELVLPNEAVKPFHFIRDAYRHRALFKSQGNMAHEALKLGLNSIYGKLAQQAGYRHGRIPTYHQLMWAGMITAACRAKLYDAAMQDPEAVIAFATDAIITTRPFQLQIGDGLGEWTPEVYEGVTIVQPGVYWLLHDSEWDTKFRGFDKGSLVRERIVEAWRNGDPYTAYLTRFVGMGGALALKDFHGSWRRWVTAPRQLDIWPSGKRVVGEKACFDQQLCDTIAAEPPCCFGMMSTAYPLEWMPNNMKFGRPIVDGIDVRILEEEMLDSYA